MALLKASRSVGDEFYQHLVTGHFRVGLASLVRPSGKVEEIIHLGKRGGLDYGRVTVRLVNGLPEPVSSPAAAIFRYFIKLQYRDVRSSVIQQVLKDFVEGGGTLVTTSAKAATTEAELAFWLHCAETRKPCVRLRKDLHGGKHEPLFISVHSPEGCCFHPDAFSHIGEVFLSNGYWNPWTLTGIEVSGSVESGEAAARAIVKQFAETPHLLVTDARDWLSAII
jgi:hypothetical protein